MSTIREAAIQYVRNHRDRFLSELKELVSIPSVSTDSRHQADMQRCAAWLVEQLRASGMVRVEVFSTGGHPVVYGENLSAGPDAPTVLIYGHYDVQPPDPLDLWQSGPFEPTVRGDGLYGRGASDNKGQIMAVLKAMEAIVCTGKLPVNVKLLIEGEEEIGSPHLEDFIASHQDLLAADFCFNPDAGMIAADQPTITYALRGLAFFELRVYGPDHDLHSGLYGGVVHNPAQVLCELIADMHDEQGRVTLPGFYDKVRPLSPEERAELARLPMDERYYLQRTGVPALWGEQGYLPAERVGARPTLEVNGLLAGFTGEGSKTVIPAQAMAKISMRLVPDQDPDEVHQQLLRFLETHAPPTVRWEVIPMAGGPASICDRHLPGVQALSRALETVWGRRPLFKREGGSIPVVAQMQKLLGIESVLTGFGLPEDNVHSPNERLHLPTWERGIEAVVHFLYNLMTDDGRQAIDKA
ncbi:MAG: dipeptidase [Anaerolineae bacterium]|nr:dipeptidase [Anaerolineae bacterium]MDW8098726.1 dipeptidase [Anaerolineae bacterium]